METNNKAWLCLVIISALSIAFIIFGCLPRCVDRVAGMRKMSRKTDAQADPERAGGEEAGGEGAGGEGAGGEGAGGEGAGGTANSGDGEESIELGEVPPPYGSAEGRRPEDAEDEEAGETVRAEEARPPAYDAVVETPPAGPTVVAGMTFPVPGR